MRVPCALLTLCALLPHAQAQETRGRIHRTEIYNGPIRTVHYSAAGLSASDARSLRELERLENEASFQNEIAALKRAYLANERLLEPSRLLARQAIAGAEMTAAGYTYPPAYLAGWSGLPGVPAAYGMPASYSLAYGLSGGFADAGIVKASLAQAIAAEASPAYAESLARARDLAAARAAGSPLLRPVAGVPRRGGDVRPVAAVEEGGVVLTLKGGETVRGTKMEESKGWVVLTLPGGRTLRIREGEVLRIETASGGDTLPAVGD